MAVDESKLDSALRVWVEESLAPLLREGGVQAESTAGQIKRELLELSREDQSGSVYAPDQYTLSVNPEAAAGVGVSVSDLHAALSRSFESLLVELGFTLNRRLHITLATDPTLAPGTVQVIVWHSGDPLKVTRELDPKAVQETGTAPEGAFLMVAGKRHMTLSQPEIRIGRLRDNDLVLEHPHVSRRHALLRLENSRYVLYDLDSTAGIQVNEVRIKSHTLRPGDVIRLADYEIIYGEQPGRPPDEAPEYKPPQKPPPREDDVTPLNMRKSDIPSRSFSGPESDEDQSTGALS